MLSEAVGLAMDKAILYGKGSAYHMPMGIVTRLAQTSKPESYPANAPEWVDLHTSNVLSISNDLTGTAFWAALQTDVAAAYNRYARGEMFWAMNSKTYAKLKAKAIATNLDGAFVAMIGGVLPVVSGDIDVLEFMPDNELHVMWSKADSEWRVYAVGSHDTKMSGWCGPDITCWSAPVYDLSDWRFEAILRDTGTYFACDMNYDL